jgi:hypothetical protein
VEFVRQVLRGAEQTRSAQTITEIVSAVIPCLDEEDAIGTVVSAVLAQRVAEVVVARRSGNVAIGLRLFNQKIHVGDVRRHVLNVGRVDWFARFAGRKIFTAS